MAHNNKAEIDSTDESEAVVSRYNTLPVLRGGGVLSFRKREVKSERSRRNRRISCLDLGSGQHEGWLFTRKPNKKKWDKCRMWCVLKNGDLYIYSSKMDSQASSRIYLPLFKIDAYKEKRYEHKAFKIYNTGTKFYFRCESKEQRNEWMNHLGLAAIEYRPPVGHIESCSTASNPSSGYDSRDYSGSELEDTVDEREVQIRSSRASRRSAARQSKLQSHLDTNEELRKVVGSIRDADLDLVGVPRVTRVQSQLRKSLAQYTAENSQKLLTLKTKQKELEVLEKELEDINWVLNNCSSKALDKFLQRYPQYSSKPILTANDSLHSISSASLDSSMENLNNNCNNDYDDEEPNQSDRSTLVAGLSDRATLIPTDSDSLDCVDTAQDNRAKKRSNRRTVILDNYLTPPDRPDSESSLSSSSSGVFKNGKHKQLSTDI